MKKIIKVSGSENGFKAVVSRKKRKGGVLTEDIDNKEVAAEAPGACSWGSETGDTTKSESINMKKECLVEKTSMPKGLCIKTKKMLEKPLGVIDYGTVNTNDDVLDNSLLLLPPLPIKPTVQEKLCFIRKIFSSVNGFGGVSTSLKFGGIIHVTFTLERAIMAAGKLANNHGVVVNTNLKHPNFCGGYAHYLSKFGLIKSIKMQLVSLWQKAISIFIRKDTVCVAKANVNKQMWDSRDKFRMLLYTLPVRTNAHNLWDFISLVGGKTCVIDRNPVSYVCARCATVCFGSESDLVSAMAATPVIKGIGLHWSHLSLVLCSVYSLSGYTSFNCVSVKVGSTLRGRKTPLSAQDQVRLVTIYTWKSAPISHLLAFSGKTWASVVGALLVHNSHSTGSLFGSDNIGKPLHSVADGLKKRLVCIKSSLVSLTGQIGKLAKKLESFVPAVFQPSLGYIVIEVGLGDATSDKTAAILGSTASPEVVKLENMLEGLSALIMSLLARLDGLALAGDDIIRWHKNINNLVSIFTKSKLKEKVHPWLANKFDGVQVFTSGLNSGFLGAGVLIIMNSSLAKHICKISEVSGQLLSIKLLFKNKLSVSILGLYAGASSVVRFFQAGKINSLIAKAVNKSSFVILGGDFNKDGSCKCASFKKFFDLGLINSLRNSSFVKSPTWCNSRGVTKTIDYVFISSNLVGAMIDHGVDGVEDYFNTNHKTVYVSVELGGLLDKYNIKNASKIKWSEFRNATAANAVMFLDEFVAAKQFFDLDAIWDIVCKIMVLLAGKTFKKKWFKSFNCVFNKVSSRFHKLELLVSKLVKTSRLDSVGTLPMKSLFLSGTSFDAIRSGLAKVRKSYCSSKLLESKHAEESSIRRAIERRIESFEIDKGHTIRSVLECPFCKVVLDHLVNSGELVLESELVKSKVDGIMEGWTRKHKVASNISGDWARQFWPLDHVFNGAFSDVIYLIGYKEMFGVILNLPNRKVAGLSGITNELWKHYNKSVLDMLLREAWVSIIPKSYEWKGVLTNIRFIALIKTARKVLSKILSDRISLACSTFNVLCGNNFSVLKSMSTQLSIFAIGSNMRKAYDFVGWEHLKRSLIRIKMCDKFIRFFGSIYNDYTNRVMTDFGLTDDYHVHNGLDQREVFLPLLWHIFYDSLLCKIKRQESICGYRLIFYFISKTGRMKFQAGLTLFLATISSSQAATQHIFNVASDFFCLNDISINNDKTVTIPINCRVAAPYLTISNMPISIAKRDEPHYYLGIFLSSKGLSKLSLAESKSASVIAFVNLVGVLGRLFSHRSYDLQILSWHPRHSLLFPVHIGVSSSNNFLAGVVHIFSGCDLSLSGSLASAFHLWSASPSGCSLHKGICGSSDICQSLGFGVICNDLLNVGATHLSVYTDGSLNNLGTVDILAGAAVFFEDIDSGLGVKGHLDVSGNERVDALAKNTALSAWHLPHLVSEKFLKAGIDTVSGNLRHFVHDIFRSIHRMHWEVGSSSQVVPGCLHADIDWLKFSLCLYDKDYPSVVCLFCDEVEVSDHVFSCFSDIDSRASLLDTYAAAWKVHSGLSCSSLYVLQLLSTCISDVTVSMVLCKGFVFDDWYHKSVSVYNDPKVAVINIVNFVCEFYLAFHDNIWLVCAKHQVIMEKNKLIPCDGSIFVTVSGFFTWLSAGVIRLLGVANAIGISFGYCKWCLFYAGVSDMASVHIST
ncbi:hypothetical protein G9A89_007645 [Geosiphon pyriformis]|nr:hypothetical protein G9A89_007645 [Geosiphon pyriformis]